MNTVSQASKVAGDLWITGNWWARRLLIGAVVWHLLTLVVGLIGVPIVTILFMVVAGSALTIAAIWYSQPLIPILAAFTSPGRTAIHWTAVVIGLELALGMYLATVPVGHNWNTRVLALMALGAAFAAIVLKIGSGWETLRGILWLKFVVLTLIIYGYGFLPDMFPALREAWHREQAQAAERIKRGESIFVEQEINRRYAKTFRFPINPTTWTDCWLPPGQTIKRWGAPGYMELAFANPVPDTLRIADGTRMFLDLSHNSFRARGKSGILFFELE